MRTSLYRNDKSKRKLYPTAPRSQHGAAVRCSCRPAPQKSWSTSCPRLTSPTARTTASARTAAQRRWDNVTGHINTNVMPVRIIGCGNAKRLWTLCKNRKNWIWSCALGWKMMRQGWLFLSAWTLTPAWKPPHRNILFFFSSTKWLTKWICGRPWMVRLLVSSSARTYTETSSCLSTTHM